MRAVIQRVQSASVSISGQVKASVGNGLLVFVGVEEADGIEDVTWLCGKIARLRIFGDAGGLMNLPVTECGSQVLVVSQFTLHASTKKGNRPSFVRAARPEKAIPLYALFLEQLASELGNKPLSGEFGANMQVELLNDGPVTILIDTKNRE